MFIRLATGLVVMGGYSCWEGRGCESLHCKSVANLINIMYESTVVI